MSEPLTILYVDDDEDIRTVATLSLALDPAFTVLGAASGAEALAMVGAGGARPQVILLDVMMPDMDGSTLAVELRKREGLADVPLIFMTARAREADVRGYYALGAAAVIAKPFDPIELAGEIRRAVAAAKAAGPSTLVEPDADRLPGANLR